MSIFKNRAAKYGKKIHAIWEAVLGRWRSLSPGIRYATVYFLCVVCIASLVWWQFNPGQSLVFDPDHSNPAPPEDLVDLNPDTQPESEGHEDDLQAGEWAAIATGREKLALPMAGEVLNPMTKVFEQFPGFYQGPPDGIHLAGTCGDTVLSAWQGVVDAVEPKGIDSYKVTINHGDWKTVYINLSDIDVGIGSYVSRGQRIGYLASKESGLYAGDFLEFQVWGSDDEPHDPLKYIEGIR